MLNHSDQFDLLLLQKILHLMVVFPIDLLLQPHEKTHFLLLAFLFSSFFCQLKIPPLPLLQAHAHRRRCSHVCKTMGLDISLFAIATLSLALILSWSFIRSFFFSINPLSHSSSWLNTSIHPPQRKSTYTNREKKRKMNSSRWKFLFLLEEEE